jgi:hypothetical protein
MYLTFLVHLMFTIYLFEKKKSSNENFKIIDIFLMIEEDFASNHLILEC